MYDCIIVGAGHNGLVCACDLAQRGWKVLVLERRPVVGGCCVTEEQWPGYKVVEGRSNRKFTSDEEVAQAAMAAGYKDIYKHTLVGITEMERLMGKENFNTILGSLVYKHRGKLTLVPESDRREPITNTTAQADFEQED
mgnify:CR=1 FL=1